VLKGGKTFGEKRYAYLSILPVVLIVALFTVYPISYALWASFRQIVFYQPYHTPFIGWGNYREVISSDYFRKAWEITLIYTGIALPSVSAIGLGIALLLNTKLKATGVLRVLILLPWAVPAVVSGILWGWIFNSTYGAFNGLLYSVGLIDKYIPLLSRAKTALLCVVFAHIWKEVPLAAILYLAGLQTIPNELYDAAKVDGAGVFTCFRHVTVPLLKAIFLIVIIYETIIGVVTFDLLYVMTGGGPGGTTSLISYFIYEELFRAFNFGHGAALSFILVVAMLALIIGYLKLLPRQEVY